MTLISDFIAGRTPPQLYETYLTPGMFSPWADDLIASIDASGACLDLACGTGIVSRKLAAAGTAARICALDVVEPMVAVARAQAEAEGLAGRIEFEIGSALAQPYPDGMFDAGFCQQGLQFFPDKVQGVKEARRVLKDGGRLAASVWTKAGDGNPVFGAFEEIVARTFGDDLVPFGPFAFGDPDALAAVVEEAGLSVRSLERKEKMVTLPDARTFVLFDIMFVGRPGADGALQPLIDPADPAGDGVISSLIEEMKAALADYIQPDGTLQAPLTANVVIAEA